MADFYIIYPERRFVSTEQIETWFSDAKANGELSAEFEDATDPNVMATALSDCGFITLAHPPRLEPQEF